MERVLITGGAGFIGLRLAEKLLGLGYDVVVLDNLSKQIHGDGQVTRQRLNELDCEFVYGDIRDARLIKSILSGVNSVIHLAAETGTGQSMYEVEKYMDVNVQATAILSKYIIENRSSLRKVVVASSRAVYGEGEYSCEEHGRVSPVQRLERDLANLDFECKCPVCAKNLNLIATSESASILPNSMYGLSKHTQEKMLSIACSSANVSFVALRYQNVYGPGQSLQNPYTGILSIFSNLILTNQSVELYEDGMPSRDFVYVDDVVSATSQALILEDLNSEVINIGSGQAITVQDVYTMLVERYDCQPNFYITGNYRAGDIRHNYADISKAREILNYKPSVGFVEGCDLFTNWVMSQSINESKYDESRAELIRLGLFKGKI